jgi:Fe2+ or Zn2+ uptake regulation protein
MLSNTDSSEALAQRLSDSGLRSTPQREAIYRVLLKKRDHPTAEEVFARAKPEMPMISLATVYNCLETLVQCNLVRAVNFERGPTRYCPNLQPHAHSAAARPFPRRADRGDPRHRPPGRRPRPGEVRPAAQF